MSQFISSYNMHEPIFYIEMDEQQDQRDSPTKNPKPRKTSGVLREREAIAANEKVVRQISNDPFLLLTNEIKERNGWGNSFDKEHEAIILKTHENCSVKSSEIAIPRKVSRGLGIRQNKENVYLRDIFDTSETSSISESESPEAHYNRFPVGFAFTI